MAIPGRVGAKILDRPRQKDASRFDDMIKKHDLTALNTWGESEPASGYLSQVQWLLSD